ncbi:MAG: MoaD/ThiS family protein [Chloroflexi bacterium]|nr:MoaD/ThiS family protein [Chloroflexota bacterium]
MPKLTVRLYATLRDLVGGRKAIEVEVPDGATVEDLVQALLEQYPELKPQILRQDGSLEPSVHVFLNGRDYHYLPDGIRTVVTTPGLEIDIFPPVGGG